MNATSNDLAHDGYNLIDEATDQRLSVKRQAEALRAALQYITADLLSDESVRFPNLFSRLDFLCRQNQVPGHLRAHLNQLRIRTNRGANHPWTEDQVQTAAKALAAFIHRVSGKPIPSAWQGEIGRPEHQTTTSKYTGKHLRVAVEDRSDEGLFVQAEDPSYPPFYLHKADHTDFADTFDGAQAGEVLSLIDVSINDERGDEYRRARLVVYQPDYLLDVSALAACFMYIAHRPIASDALWFINRFGEKDSTTHLFLGNLVNSFFDALVSAPDELPEFKTLFAESFANFPLEYVRHFPEDAQLLEFMNAQALRHYHNLCRIVQHDLKALRPPVPRGEPLIEPTFMSPELGLQGRLDLLHLSGNQATIIELKSGKLPWPPDDPDAVNYSHAAQARMYQMLVNRVLGRDFKDIHVYLMYSSGNAPGSNLRYVVRYAGAETAITALRNQIVRTEKALAEAESVNEVFQLLGSWNYHSLKLPTETRTPQWFSDIFTEFDHQLGRLSALSRDYLCAFAAFIAREQWMARLGDGKFRLGHSAIWNKNDQGASDDTGRLGPLTITDNRMAESTPRLTLHLEGEQRNDHDFRRGDIVVLFPSDHAESTAVQRQVIKAYLVEEPNADGELTLGFRYPQQHTELFTTHRLWSIEHDYMDQSFTSMQRELLSFTTAADSKRELLLGERLPHAPETFTPVEPKVNDALLPESRQELRELLTKAVHAPECFLLVGPPGTGKTSMFLANLIREAHDRGEQLLLLAYTNRAVDEICEAVEQALGGGEHYFRIGSGSAGDPRYESSLLHRLAGGMANRKALQELIRSRRVVVSTVSAILSRNDIFALKHFNRIVVDEASQVLEPLLVNLLRKAERFILIGDDRQLPAVVQQSERSNRLLTERLKKVGLTDLRASLFERMLSNFIQQGCSHAMGSLRFQGRMHPAIGNLVGQRWYGGLLHPAGRPHQQETLEISGIDNYLRHRLIYINGGDREPGLSQKVNPQEAAIVARLVHDLAAAHGLSGKELGEAIGIIAPYRNQIGRIKRALAVLGLEGTEAITVDTVERYQGSQRDVIIYATTATSVAQLRFLTAHTRPGIDETHAVDRKLNVAITRARKQFILIGKRSLLDQSEQYAGVIRAIEAEGVICTANDLLSGANVQSS